jgi:hypothetical protein
MGGGWGSGAVACPSVCFAPPPPTTVVSSCGCRACDRKVACMREREKVTEQGRADGRATVRMRATREAHQMWNEPKCGTKVVRSEVWCVGDDREVVGGCESRERKRKKRKTSGSTATASPLNGSELSTIYRSTFTGRSFSSDAGTQDSQQPGHTTGSRHQQHSSCCMRWAGSTAAAG